MLEDKKKAVGGGGNRGQCLAGTLCVAFYKCSRKIAFTLAEVLITIAVIGIVAALTMPMLIANYQKRQTVVQLKKVYSELSQAVQLSAVQNGDIQNWNFQLSIDEFFNTYLSSFLKISEQSVGEAYNNGIAYYESSGNRELYLTNVYSNSRIVTLASGAQILMSTVDWDTNPGYVIDLNGFKSPNKFGRDVFVFEVTPDGVQPYQWNDGEDRTIKRLDRDILRNGPSGFRYNCNKSGRGMWCAALIMSDGWKIKSDYPW